MKIDAPDTIVLVSSSDGTTHSEAYDPKKLFASVEAAALSVGLATGLAADTARNTTDAVSLWLSNKPEVMSGDIRRIATQSLTIVSPEAAYLYKHHHQIL